MGVYKKKKKSRNQVQVSESQIISKRILLNFMAVRLVFKCSLCGLPAEQPGVVLIT